MTRQKLDVLDDEHGARVLRQGIDTVSTTHCPERLTHDGFSANRKITFYELYAPLAHDGEHIDTVLFASYAETRR